MDFDDDDDWDANALAKLETEAVNAYAATQHRATQVTETIESRPITEKQHRQDAPSTDFEKANFEKLARDKEGELLILRSNMTRTTADHAHVLEKVKESNRIARLELEEQLAQYKDRVVQLETDLTFQQQELKESKLRAAQLGTQSQVASPHRPSKRNSARVNGFPNKGHFETADPQGTDLSIPNSRKRRRNQQVTGNLDVDEFELADLKLQHLSKLASHSQAQERSGTRSDFDDRPYSPIATLASFGSPAISKETTSASDRSVHLDNGISVPSIPPISHAWAIHCKFMGVHASDGTSSMKYLFQADLVPSQGLGMTIGQAILDIFSQYASDEDHRSVVLRVTQLLSGQIVMNRTATGVIRHSFSMLFQALKLLDQATTCDLMNWFEEAETNHLVQTLQDFIISNDTVGQPLDALMLLEAVVNNLDRNSAGCKKMRSMIRLGFVKSTLTKPDGECQLRTTLLRIIAKLAVKDDPLLSTPEMLDYVTTGFEQCEGPERKQIHVAIAQCLYCLVLYNENGLEQARKSRHVIPRIIKCLSRTVDGLFDRFDHTETLVLIRMLVKLYHILLAEDDALAEHHWRIPEVKAAHLTTMTRILYAEEHNNLDNATQDLAMDLLEMAISPEEGNDIYEVMGTMS